jgi:hypothetical protein
MVNSKTELSNNLDGKDPTAYSGPASSPRAGYLRQRARLSALSNAACYQTKFPPQGGREKFQLALGDCRRTPRKQTKSTKSNVQRF